MVAGDQPGGVLRSREQHPAVPALGSGHSEQEVGLLGLSAVPPLQPPSRIARATRQDVSALGHPDLDPAPAEAADDAEASVIAADDEGPDRAHRVTPRARLRAAKPLPATNLMSGPKLHAAGAPRTWRPGTEVSKASDSTG